MLPLVICRHQFTVHGNGLPGPNIARVGISGRAPTPLSLSNSAPPKLSSKLPNNTGDVDQYAPLKCKT
jgi:hypothetical protein